MVFLYANDATAPAVNDAICISKRTRPRRRDRARLLTNILPIEPLIGEVGEVNDPLFLQQMTRHRIRAREFEH